VLLIILNLQLWHKKIAIQEWFERNNINYEEEMTRTELLQSVWIQHPPHKCHRFHFSRTQPYHCDLNAIEFTWNIFKTKVAHKSVGQSAAVIQNLMVKFIKNINVEDWKSGISHVEKK
jgi:hypothetical protein